MNEELKRLLNFLNITIILGDGQLHTYEEITSTDLRRWAKMISNIIYGNTLILDKEKLKKRFYNEELEQHKIIRDWFLTKSFCISASMMISDCFYDQSKGKKEFEDSVNNVLSNELMKRFEEDFKVEE